jgi:hypothetical protein
MRTFTATNAEPDYADPDYADPDYADPEKRK